MRKVFDLMAIVGGLIGLGSLILNAGDLTPETAVLYSARAITVMAFVVVPFFIARALEKSSINVPVKRLMTARTRQPQPASQTTFFDYLFQPGSAYDWQSNRIASMQNKRNTDDARGVEI